MLGFFFYGLFGKIWKNRIPKVPFAALCSIILSPLIYQGILIAFFSLIFYEYHPERDFNKESWNEEIQNRHEMSTDLVENDILIGKSKAEIIEMLGSPNSSQKSDQDTITTWQFNLGNEGHAMGWKFYTLIIKFEEDRARKIEIEELID
ncbi:hypothetical protein [Christiangramia gaetbulicola]|uniref:hypothetical protein n=1 Tax=Christiangramia gaetbulicola TaxID=703340 RepID=UPI0011B291E6|nr:hypothetical protein [Christiangramia gaetbulicola]